MVKMRNLENGNEWLWDRNKFINRKFLMQEMYQNYVEGADDWDVPKVSHTGSRSFLSFLLHVTSESDGK